MIEYSLSLIVAGFVFGVVTGALISMRAIGDDE